MPRRMEAGRLVEVVVSAIHDEGGRSTRIIKK
jgi:hypothetical protein